MPGLLALTLLSLSFSAGCREATRRQAAFLAIDGVLGLQNAVRVLIDVDGVPHIYAGSRRDAALALGWLHARDRLLQMDLYRRSGHGRLSELLGVSALEDDRLARLLGLGRAARQAWDRLEKGSPEREILLAYTAGINRYLERVPERSLPEFYRENRLQPEAWRPEDCFAVFKRLALDWGHSVDDLRAQLIAEKLGVEAVDELFHERRDLGAAVVRQPIRADILFGLGPAAWARSAPAPVEDREIAPIGDALPGIIRRLSSSNFRLGPPDRSGSAWVVGQSRSADRRPIVCAQSQLSLTRPPPLYIAHLVSPSLSVAGVTLPGIPAVILGRNQSIAWAGSPAQVDVTDFYVERMDPENPRRYFYRDGSEYVEEREEIIRVRGGDDLRVTVRETRNGPIVSEEGAIAISMRWTGELPTTEPSVLIRMNAARDLQEFLDSLRDYVSPAFTFLYADERGNIAARVSGWAPRRSSGSGRFPFDGSRGDGEWVGFVPFEEMPLTLNPPEGYIVSAGQLPVAAGPAYPHALGRGFPAPFRARRIDEILDHSYRITPRDMVLLQLDSVDLRFAGLVPVLVDAFRQSPPQDPIARVALRMLQGWDFRASPHVPEPTIASEWLRDLEEAVWRDEWERAGLPTDERTGFGPSGWFPPEDVLIQLTGEPDSAWFDNVETEERESRDDVIRASFLRTIARLTEELGPGVASWQWGKRNRLVIPDLLRRPEETLEVGAVQGTIHTVSSGGTGKAVTSGDAARLVISVGGDSGRALRATPGLPAGALPGVPEANLLDRQMLYYLTGQYPPLRDRRRLESFPETEVAQILTMSPGPR